jgi:hypothetical protein
MSQNKKPLPGYLKHGLPDDHKNKPGPGKRPGKKLILWPFFKRLIWHASQRRRIRGEERLKRKAIRHEMLIIRKENRISRKAERRRIRNEQKAGRDHAGTLLSRLLLNKTSGEHLHILIHSTAIFLLAYLITYLLYQFVVIVTASFYEIDGVLYFYRLAFNDASTLWRRFNIILITGSAPFICLAVGLFIYLRIYFASKLKGYSILFLMWLSMHLINHFLGAFTSGMITSRGFGYVASWLYMGMGLKLFVSLVFLLLLMIMGYYAAPRFLLALEDKTSLNNKNKNTFLGTLIIIPALLGTLLLFLIRIPQNFSFPYETILFFTLLLGMAPAVFYSGDIHSPQKKLPDPGGRWRSGFEYFIILILLLIFYRTVLDQGLQIIMRFDFFFSVRMA